MSSEIETPEDQQTRRQIEELEAQNQALEARVDALNAQLNEVKRLLLGEREMNEDAIQARESFLATLERYDDDVEQAHEMAKGAQVAVQELDKRVGTEGSTQDQIRAVVRDQLVKDALLGNHQAEYVGIRLADFDHHTPPDVDVHYQQAKRVTDDLVSNWTAFVEDTNGDGERVVRALVKAINQDLANKCERSLGRDGLANIVVSRDRGGSR